MKLTV
jgi:predicted amidohydrolase YtcJ